MRVCYFPSCFQQKPEEVKERHDTSLHVVRILSEICRMKFDDICGLLEEDRDCDIREIIHNELLRRFPSSPKIPFIISDLRVQSDGKTDYYRVFLNTRDCTRYEEEVGWVIKEHISHCMICSVSFNNTASHHCRACGNVICSKCSPSKAVVVHLSEEIEVRVCQVCCWGQTPVQCLNSRKLGKSLLIEEDSFSLTEEAEIHNPIVLGRGVGKDLSQFDEPKISLKWNSGTLKALKDLIHLNQLIYLKEHGPFTLRSVQPVMMFKAFYWLEDGIDQIQKDYRPPPYFIYINLCSSPALPNDHRVLHHEHTYYGALASEDISVEEFRGEVFPLIFTLLAEKFKNVPITDAIVNNELLEKCLVDCCSLPELYLQLLLGVSLCFPDYRFSHLEKQSFSTSVDNVTLSPLVRKWRLRQHLKRHVRDNAALFSMKDEENLCFDEVMDRKSTHFISALPDLSAITTFRYCYISLTDVILSSKALTPNEDPSNRSGKELTMTQKMNLKKKFPHLLLEFLQLQRNLFQNLADVYRVNPKELDESADSHEISATTSKETLSITPSSSQQEGLLIYDSEDSRLSDDVSWGIIPEKRSKPKMKMLQIKLARSGTHGLRLPEEGAISPVFRGSSGKLLVNASSMEIIPALKVADNVESLIREQARQDATIMIGWQINLFNNKGKNKGIYVITGYSYSVVFGHLYRVSRWEEEDRWVKLKLGKRSSTLKSVSKTVLQSMKENRKLYTFVLLRKILSH